MDSFTYIDDYFKESKISARQTDFEQKVLSDKEFAEDVAFYLAMMQVARSSNDEEKKKRFKEIYYQSDNSYPRSYSLKRLWPYVTMAAAVLCALVFGIYFYTQPADPATLALNYENVNLNRLGIQMGNAIGLLQIGRNLYNSKDYPGALNKFEELVKKDTSDYDAKEDAGITALKLQNYDKALMYFRQVANNEDRAENKGKFYLALTLMNRNKPGDKEQYRKLLQEVINENLPDKIEAKKFLDKM